MLRLGREVVSRGRHQQQQRPASHSSSRGLSGLLMGSARSQRRVHPAAETAGELAANDRSGFSQDSEQRPADDPEVVAVVPYPGLYAPRGMGKGFQPLMLQQHSLRKHLPSLSAGAKREAPSAISGSRFRRRAIAANIRYGQDDEARTSGEPRGAVRRRATTPEAISSIITETLVRSIRMRRNASGMAGPVQNEGRPHLSRLKLAGVDASEITSPGLMSGARSPRSPAAIIRSGDSGDLGDATGDSSGKSAAAAANLLPQRQCSRPILKVVLQHLDQAVTLSQELKVRGPVRMEGMSCTGEVCVIKGTV